MHGCVAWGIGPRQKSLLEESYELLRHCYLFCKAVPYPAVRLAEIDHAGKESIDVPYDLSAFSGSLLGTANPNATS